MSTTMPKKKNTSIKIEPKLEPKAVRRPHEPVVEVPARCPRRRCRSTRRKKKQGVDRKTMDQQGRTQAGEPFNQIIFSYVECLDCGQHYSIRAFHYIPREAKTD